MIYVEHFSLFPEGGNTKEQDLSVWVHIIDILFETIVLSLDKANNPLRTGQLIKGGNGSCLVDSSSYKKQTY